MNIRAVGGNREPMRPRHLLAFLLLASCASYGTYVSDEKVAKLRKGMTMAEVRAVLGTPQMDIPIGGTREWHYTYSSAYSLVVVTKASGRSVRLVFRKGALDEVPGFDLKEPDAQPR